MDPQPPTQFVAYPRDSNQYGSADKLQALSEGYFGLNTVFVINLVLFFGFRVASVASTDPATALGLFFGTITVLGLVVGFATYPHNKKIGFGCDWSSAGPVIASTLMGLNSALCCGIIGYVVVQQIAANEMKKYGIKAGFGLKKRDIEQRVQMMRAAQSPAPAPPPQGPFPPNP